MTFADTDPVTRPSATGRLSYSPRVRILVETQTGIVDVSDDLIRFNVSLADLEAGGHSVSMEITNERRKYHGLFTSGDKWLLQLRRFRTLTIATGYLDIVPVATVQTNSVNLTGSCTLKRLRRTMYDPGAPATVELLNAAVQYNDTVSPEELGADSGVETQLLAALTEIVGWDRGQIHIGGIPAQWSRLIDQIYAEIRPELEATDGSSFGGVLSGPISPDLVGTRTYTGDSDPQIGPGFGILPTYSNTVTEFGSRTGYLIALDWFHLKDPNLSRAQIRAAERWWSRRKIAVLSPETNKAVICRPRIHRPAPTTIGLSHDARRALEIAPDDARVILRFVDDDRSLGPMWLPNDQPADPITSPTSGFLHEFNSTERSDTYNSPTLGTLSQFLNEDRGAPPVFEDKDNLESNVVAARTFIRENFSRNNTSIGGWRRSGSVPNSDHPKGLALDVVIPAGGIGSEPTNAEIAQGNAIAWWFVQNPEAYGTEYVIWNNMRYDSRGARAYLRRDRGQNEVTLGHRDHIHISFKDTEQTALGPTGSAWPIPASEFFLIPAFGGVLPTYARARSASDFGGSGAFTGALVTPWSFTEQGDPMSSALTGIRVLMNDRPVNSLISQLTMRAQRKLMAAPNGDIVCWWPDYFNDYGYAPRLIITDVELQAFEIVFSDRGMITHSFVTGSPAGTQTEARALFADAQISTHGVATIEQQSVLAAISHAPPGSLWRDPSAILQRFGARILNENLEWVLAEGDRRSEFYIAFQKLREAWAGQFAANIPITFMPEAMPGMIVQIPTYGLQAYVERVQHTATLGTAGKFSTNLTIIAPSTIGENSQLIGLVQGGSFTVTPDSAPPILPGGLDAPRR